jgi:hypothetical protein
MKFPRLFSQWNFDDQTAHNIVQLQVFLRTVRMGGVTANVGLGDGAIRLGSMHHPAIPSCLDALQGRTLG